MDATARGFDPPLDASGEGDYDYEPQGPPLPTCVPNIDRQPVGRMGTFQSDGKWHYKYDFQGATGNILSAMQRAIRDWNVWSNLNQVVFDPMQPGEYAEVQFNAVPGGLICAAYNTDTSRIDWEPGLAGVADSDLDGAAAVFKHELGHFLALNDAGRNPRPITIMGNPTMIDTCANAVATGPTRLIWENDAKGTSYCTAQVRQSHR